jgi:hypothetical protein
MFQIEGGFMASNLAGAELWALDTEESMTDHQFSKLLTKRMREKGLLVEDLKRTKDRLFTKKNEDMWEEAGMWDKEDLLFSIGYKK